MRTLHRATAAALLLMVLAACTDAPGPVEPAPDETQRIELIDDEGHTHLLQRAWSGHRVAEERHYIDGELFSITTTTYKMDGTPEGRQLAVYADRRLAQVIDLSVLPTPALDLALLPGGPSYQTAAIRCKLPIVNLLTASGGLAFAVGIRSPAGVIAAAQAYINAMEKLRNCYRGGGGGN